MSVPFAPPLPPAGMNADDVKRWEAYIATLTRAWQESSGIQRQQIEAQIQNAKDALANAREIANISAQTSRYGTDVQAQTRLAELKQNQQQYDATHALDMQKYGLSVAEAYTKYSQTPDMMWAQADFKDALGRVGQGLAPRPITSATPQPKAKSWEDFAALSGYNTPVVQAGQSGGGQAYSGGSGSGGAASGGGPDLRLKAMKAIGEAMPPSETEGNDGQDWEALNAIRSLYFARRPGSVEKLGGQRQKIAEAGLARMGYDPGLVREEYQRSRPGQGSVRRA